MKKIAAVMFAILAAVIQSGQAADKDFKERQSRRADVDKPEYRERARLRQGVRKGKLTREEARKLRRPVDGAPRSNRSNTKRNAADQKEQAPAEPEPTGGATPR